MSADPLKRRAFLRLVACLPLVWSGSAFAGAARLSRIERAYWRVGREYAGRFPDDAATVADDARLTAPRDELRRQIEQDFTAGHTVLLNGWVLSRTECRVCARAYLLGDVDVH